MRRYTALLLLLLCGCFTAAQEPVKPKRVIPSRQATPDTGEKPFLTVEASDSWLSDLHKWLGDSNVLQIEQALSVRIPGLSVAIPAGARISYTLTDTGGMVKFENPRPVITTVQYGVTLHPYLNAIELRPKDGIATVQEGPFIRKKGFAINWDGGDKSAGLPEVTFTEPELPELWMYSTKNCGQCEVAKRAMKEAKDLPFKFVVIEGEPPFARKNGAAHQYPTFWWHKTQPRPSVEDLPNTRTPEQPGWPGLKNMLDQWHKSRGTTPTAMTAPKQVLFGNHWVERATGRTSIQHLTQDHGLAYADIQPWVHDETALCAIHGWKHEGWGVPYSEWNRMYRPYRSVELQLNPGKDDDDASTNVVAKTSETRRRSVGIRIFDLRS
jgi:glutaredoxin